MGYIRMKIKVKFISNTFSANDMEAEDVMIRLSAGFDHAMIQIFEPTKKQTRRFF